jgi:hypothetical protein
MTVFIVVALAAYPIILLGLLGWTVAILTGSDDLELRPVLVPLGAFMSIGAGVYAYVLGGRVWAAVLTAVPGIAGLLILVLQHLWLYIVLLASPLAILAGIAGVAVAMSPRAAAASEGERAEPGRPKQQRLAQLLSAGTGASGPELSALALAEREWIDDRVAIAAERGAGVDDLAGIRSLYERSMARWHAMDAGHRDDPSETINLIGAAFGEHLARRSPLRWRVATDEYDGTDLVLNEAHTRMLIYPADAVAKHWVAGESGAFLDEIAGQVSTRFPDQVE